MHIIQYEIGDPNKKYNILLGIQKIQQKQRIINWLFERKKYYMMWRYLQMMEKYIIIFLKFGK